MYRVYVSLTTITVTKVQTCLLKHIFCVTGNFSLAANDTYMK